MIKLLIVDDEPLVQVGIKSMLDWKKLDIEICGTAFNGQQALEAIEVQKPEIVLCDIKMPIMTGLELLKIVRDKYDDLPVFIFLTSYDEFSLVKEAIHYHAFEYLVKLDLNAEVLKTTIQRCLKQVHQMTHYESKPKGIELQGFYDRFMLRLLNGLFDDEEQLKRQAGEIGISFEGKNYSIAYCTITDFVNSDISKDKLISLYTSSVEMLNSLLSKQIECKIVSLDTKRFCILLSYETQDLNLQQDQVFESLGKGFQMIGNYFNINIYASVGRSYDQISQVQYAYQDARQIHRLCSNDEPILFYQEKRSQDIGHSTFHLGIFKNDIQMAFESYDSLAFEKTIHNLIELFHTQADMYLQAMDAAGNLLYLTLFLLPSSEETLNAAFKDYPEGYRSLYSLKRIDQVIRWMEIFSQGITSLLQAEHKTFKNHMINNVLLYVDDHLHLKLSLQDMAALFNISPNYLSVLFKKTVGIGFNEYITNKKIAYAKARLLKDDVLVYELAEELGYENAFYFSKVFKKVEGCSPSAFVEKMKTSFFDSDHVGLGQ